MLVRTSLKDLKSRDSSVGTETSNVPDGPGFESRQGQVIFCSLKRPHRCWGPSRLLLFSTAVLYGGLSGRSVIMTAHLRLSQRLRPSGAIPVLPLYTFMPWTRIALTFIFSFQELGSNCAEWFDEWKVRGRKISQPNSRHYLAFARRPGTQESHKIYEAS